MGNSRQPLSLKMFYAVWADLEGFDHIPNIHIQVLEFLDKWREWKNNTAVLEAFRNSAKSSIVAPFVVWLLTVDPTLVVLVQSADDETAKKMVEDCKKVVTFHPYAQHLKGKKQQWNAFGFRIEGAKSGREMSVRARGIFSNIVGGRADLVVYDDVEVPKNSQTKIVRNVLRTRLSESTHLLQPGGCKLYIGTPHSYESIYPEIVEKGAEHLVIPQMTNVKGEFPNLTGTPTWKERWGLEACKKKQLDCKSKEEYYSQYLLKRLNPDGSQLDPISIKKYSVEVDLSQSIGKRVIIRLGAKTMHAVCAFFDPSTNTGKAASVLSIVFQDEEGNYYIHRTIAIESPDPELQCDAIKDIAIEFRLPSVVVETPGVGGLLPVMLRKRLRPLGIAVLEHDKKENKAESILTAFSTPLSAGMIWAHESVFDTPFEQQMRDFTTRGAANGRLDYIDATAKAIHRLPILSRSVRVNVPQDFSTFKRHLTTYDYQRDSARR